MKIRNKVFSFAMAAPAVFSALTICLIVVFYMTNRDAIAKQNNVRAAGVQKIFQDFRERTHSYSEMISSTKAVQEGADLTYRHYIKSVIQPLFDSLSVDLITVHEKDGYVIARGHKPNIFGEYERDLPYVAAALSGEQTSGIATIDGRLSVISTTPIDSKNIKENPHVGACTVGYFLDEHFAERIKGLVGSEIIITVNYKPVASTLDNGKKKGSGSTAINLSGDTRNLATGGRSYDLKYVPLQAGKDIDDIGLFIAVDNTNAKRTMFIIILVSLFTIAITSFVIIRRAWKFSATLSSPIIETAEHAKKVADGDLNVAPLRIKREDEIGILISSFNVMLSNLQSVVEKDRIRREYLEAEVSRLLEVMNSAASGDMTVHFEHEHDDEMGRVGDALNKMISDIREMNDKEKEQREYLERQVRKMLSVINTAAAGDLSVSFEAEREDEIGMIGDALNNMISDLERMIQLDKQRRRELERKATMLLKSISSVTQGDLTVTFPAEDRDEFGRIGIALNQMMADLNRKIETIEDLKRQDRMQREDLEKNVNTILAGVTRAADGDLTVNLSGVKHGTINALISNLNSMFFNLRNMMSQVQESAALVEHNCRDINRMTQTVEKGVLKQSTMISGTTGSVEGMAGTIARMAEHAEDVKKIAITATDNAKKGGGTAKNAKNGMTLVSESMTGINEIMNELGASAEEIDDIVKVIDEISDQTNLLALNASIEAARAGEMGRGFAVVAREVGNLAQLSSDSTREITLIVRRIQDRLIKIRKASDTGRNRVDEGSELVAGVGSALENIVESVSRVSSLISDTTADLEDQNSESQNILVSVKNIKSISDESSVIIQQTAKSVEALFVLARNLEALVDQFKINKT